MKQKISSPILEEIVLIIFLQYRFYPNVEFYGCKKNSKNIYLTDIKARKGLLRRRAFISYKLSHNRISDLTPYF